MGPTEKLIYDYAERGHFLARPLEETEVEGLINDLLIRLESNSNKLDYTFLSIKHLEAELIAYNKALKTNNQHLSEEDTLRLTREVTAYIVKTLIVEGGGELHIRGGNLWDTAVRMTGQWKIVDEDRSIYTPKRPPVIIAGGGAAITWDKILASKKPTLYADLKNVQRKHLPKERL